MLDAESLGPFVGSKGVRLNFLTRFLGNSQCGTHSRSEWICAAPFVCCTALHSPYLGIAFTFPCPCCFRFLDPLATLQSTALNLHMPVQRLQSTALKLHMPIQRFAQLSLRLACLRSSQLHHPAAPHTAVPCSLPRCTFGFSSSWFPVVHFLVMFECLGPGVIRVMCCFSHFPSRRAVRHICVECNCVMC